MKEDELFRNLCVFATEDLTYEEYHSMGLENFRAYVKAHYRPIEKSRLKKGETYHGECRNASKATWDGEKFIYERYKFGCRFNESINHYEDDDPNEEYDVFVPIEYYD